MTNIAETKARLLNKHINKALEEAERKNAIDLTPIIDYLKKSLSYVESYLSDKLPTTSNARDLKHLIHYMEWKEELVYLIGSMQKQQNDPQPKNIHILAIYLFPQLYNYAQEFERSNDCRVSPVYDAIGKVLCNWSGHTYYGDN